MRGWGEREGEMGPGGGDSCGRSWWEREGKREGEREGRSCCCSCLMVDSRRVVQVPDAVPVLV